MNKAMLPLAIIIGVVLLFLFASGACLVSRYNNLVDRDEKIDEQWAQIENVLQRRAELIPNLAETVRAHADHESEVFSQIADARSRILNARGPNEAAEANAGMQSALGRLMAISENYPDLRTSESFTRLQDEIAGSDNRISNERRRYNEAVGDYNSAIRRFPNSFLANMAGLEAREYFEADAEAREVPELSFD